MGKMSTTKKAGGPDRDEELRQIYAALKVHHTFDRVAAAFEPADLTFLLTDTDALKIAYLAYHKDLPVGARLR